jgi:glycosyltransferase involved in cell wall biosynthesis
VEYEGIPCPFPERWNAHSLHLPKSHALAPAVRGFAPDVVHAFGMETGSATVALRTGFPVSCFIQGIAERLAPYYGQRGLISREVAVRLERAAVKRLRWMVAETEFARAWALGHRPDAHVALIPHPLRGMFLERADPGREKRVISIGGLDDRKGMDTVIRAFAQVEDPEARLCIVGGGPLSESLRHLAAELGLADRVEFTGGIATDAVIEQLNRASVSVIASRMDTSPNVVTEAHAIGLPVIGTRAGGIPEMIEDGGDGFHVDVDDAGVNGRRMAELLADPDKARRMGEAGRRKVKVLNDPARIAEAHVEFFEKVRTDLRKGQSPAE